MPIIKKKEPVEEIFFNELEDIISYNMKQMEHCLTTIGKRMCAKQEKTWKKDRKNDHREHDFKRMYAVPGKR